MVWKICDFPGGSVGTLAKKAGTPFADQDRLCQARAYFFHDFILQQPDKEVIIVSHGDFCHFLVNRWTDSGWLWCNPGWFDQENAQGWPMKLVKKKRGKTRKIRKLEKEKTGLYQLQVFDELKDHVDSCVANIRRN